MDLLFSFIIIFIYFPSYFCNLTYVLSHIPTSEVTSLIRSNALILTNSTYVMRLPTSSVSLLTSTQTLFASNNIQSLVFTWNTGDCSYPAALATNFSTIYISSPICFTSTSTSNNLLQLTATVGQLGQAASSYMSFYTLHYFTMITSDSNDFYFTLVQQFASYLTENSFMYERLILKSNFSYSTISSLKSRGQYEIFAAFKR
jgi:hypothetical protein